MMIQWWQKNHLKKNPNGILPFGFMCSGAKHGKFMDPRLTQTQRLASSTTHASHHCLKRLRSRLGNLSFLAWNVKESGLVTAGGFWISLENCKKLLGDCRPGLHRSSHGIWIHPQKSSPLKHTENAVKGPSIPGIWRRASSSNSSWRTWTILIL